MRLSLLTLFILAAFSSQAQITITDSTFPVAGDTLKVATDNLPTGILLGTFGGPQIWDYSTLEAPFTSNQIFLNAADGTAFVDFPQADLFVDLPSTGEGYYRIINGEVRFLGFYGSDPLGFGLDLAFKYNPPLVEQRAPLDFGDSFDSEASIVTPFSADVIPGTILDSLPVAPDSLRIRTNIIRDESVDAYGTMTIPGGTFEVLRMTREETREVRLEAKVPFINWIDITDFLPSNPFLGDFEVKSYVFLADESKEPIAEVRVDPETDEVQSVQFKSIEETINATYQLNGQPAMFAYPNPAIEDVRFEFANLPAGLYTLKIYNILGSVVWKKDYQVAGNKAVRENLGQLRKGTYLYSLVGPTGKTVATKRLLIVRP
jgi:hypothetical protein